MTKKSFEQKQECPAKSKVAKEYPLEQKLEPRIDKPALPAEIFLKPLAKNIKYEKKGVVKIEKGDLTLEFSYSSISRKDKAEFYTVEPEIWRKLDSFILKTKKGKPLDLSDIFKSGYKVFFKTTDYSRFGGDTDVENKYCFTNTNLLKPATILGIVHELGHCVSYQELKKKDPEKAQEQTLNLLDYHFFARPGLISDKKILRQIFKTILKEERIAWAFALKKIKPLLTSDIFTKENVLKYIHNYALKTYSDLFRLKLGDQDIARSRSEFFSSLEKAWSKY